MTDDLLRIARDLGVDLREAGPIRTVRIDTTAASIERRRGIVRPPCPARGCTLSAHGHAPHSTRRRRLRLADGARDGFAVAGVLVALLVVVLLRIAVGP